MVPDYPDLESIFDLYYRDVYHFSLFYTNNKQEAEDITQETFLKVMKNISQLKDYSKVKTWIFSIAKNTAIDIQRKQKLINYIPKLLHHAESPPSTNDLDKELIRQEYWQLLQTALLKLKPHYRRIIILRGIKEFSVKETAEILECTELKIRVDYHRGLQLMKKHLSGLDERWAIHE